MKPSQAPLKEISNKVGERKNKESKSQVQARNVNPKWDTKGQRNKLCSKAFTSCEKHTIKGKGNLKKN
jgi:hypothetical protein